MADSILWGIVEDVEVAIAGILEVDDYSCDWGSVGEYDLAKATFPSALVDIVEEENQDEDFHAGAYSNIAVMEITITDQVDDSAEYPHRAIRKNLYNRIDDMKKLFAGDEYFGAFKIEYQGFSIERTDDHFTSGTATVRFAVYYTQDRNSPTTPAC